MKNIKIFLLFSAAMVILLSGCGNVMNSTDDLSIDLSSVISRTAGTHARVWLVADGTNNFYYEAEHEIINDKITIANIPVGPDYHIYLTVGTKSGDVFTAKEAVNGMVNVTGGAATAVEMDAVAIKTTLFNELTGTSVKGAAYVDNAAYTISSDGSKLYTGISTAVSSLPAPSGKVFRDIDEGLLGRTGIGSSFDKAVVITANSTGNGKAIGTINGSNSLASTAWDFSADLDTDFPGGIDLLSSFIYVDGETQLGISQKNGGIVLSIYQDFDGAGGNPAKTEWLPVDFSGVLDSMEDLSIDLGGEFFKGFAVMKSGNNVSIYVSSKIGNFRLPVVLDENGIKDEGLGGADADIMSFLTDFIKDHASLKNRAILNIGNGDNTYLYVGTDAGLYKLDAGTAVDNMTVKATFAENYRVEMFEVGSAYTAVVTPLNLIIINNSTEATASVAFNEGLPVEGLLTEGITGLNWNGSTLYIAGNYGFASLDASKLF